MMFQRSFVLQFCSRMDLIAATRAEGGLVEMGLTSLLPIWIMTLNILGFFRVPLSTLLSLDPLKSFWWVGGWLWSSNPMLLVSLSLSQSEQWNKNKV